MSVFLKRRIFIHCPILCSFSFFFHCFTIIQLSNQQRITFSEYGPGNPRGKLDEIHDLSSSLGLYPSHLSCKVSLEQHLLSFNRDTIRVVENLRVIYFMFFSYFFKGGFDQEVFCLTTK